MKHLLLASGVLASLALVPSAANAATIISCGGASACIADTDNVLLTSANNVAIGMGQTNTNPPVQVQFTSMTDLLNLDASGQASISAVDQVLNNLTFSLLGGATFQRAEFNLLNGATSPLSVTIATNTGSNTFTLANSNGANRFGITAAPGEILTSATFTSVGGFDSFRQLRLGGIGTGGQTPGQSGAVPEPSTWAMMLIGFGAVGFGMRRRRKEQTRVRFAF
jgi:hypothetical protein